MNGVMTRERSPRQGKKNSGKKQKTFLSFRQHPVKIIKYTTKYLWLLLFSLGKYLIAVEFDIARWLHANWFDIMIVVVIFIFAFVRWVTVYFELAQDRIIGHTGFLGMARTVVYFDEIASFSVCQGPWRMCFTPARCTSTPTQSAFRAPIYA